MEIFWEAIARYNSATWWVQLVVIVAAVVLTLRLGKVPTPRMKLVMKLFLALVSLWIAVVYTLVFGHERSYASVSAIFWVMIAGTWVIDALINYTDFEPTHRSKALAAFLYILPLAYPVISIARGMEYPMVITPLMPCSVAAFMTAILLSFSKRANLFAVLFICHWSVIGLSKAVIFRVPEDFILAGAMIPAMYIFFHDYIENNVKGESKPTPLTLKILLLILCSIMSIFFLWKIFEYLP